MRVPVSALSAMLLCAIPATVFAQSTVGSVPSNPNSMPAVDGSSAPKVTSHTSTRHKKSTSQSSSSTPKSR